MLPSEVRGRSGSHSGSMMSSAMTRVLAVAIKPRSRAASISSRSRSQAESSIHIEASERDNKPTSRTIDITPRESSLFNPYNSNKDAVGANGSALLHSVKGSQRREMSSKRVGGGGSDSPKGMKPSALGTIQSGESTHRSFPYHHVVESGVDLAGNTPSHIPSSHITHQPPIEPVHAQTRRGFGQHGSGRDCSKWPL